MKPKHLAIRIKQCLALAEASECPRRKFGALLLDPERNVVLMDGYNGGPRGGTSLCGGAFCKRNGAPEERERYRLGFSSSSGNQSHRSHDQYQMWLVHPANQHGNATPVGKPESVTGMDFQAAQAGVDLDAFARSWGERVVEEFIAANPPIQSGNRVEVGCHHAEMNLICNAAASGVATRGALLIVTGEPCLMCAKLVHHAGITRVICVKGGYAGGRDGIEYLREHRVLVEYAEGPIDPRFTCEP